MNLNQIETDIKGFCSMIFQIMGFTLIEPELISEKCKKFKISKRIYIDLDLIPNK